MPEPEFEIAPGLGPVVTVLFPLRAEWPHVVDANGMKVCRIADFGPGDEKMAFEQRLLSILADAASWYVATGRANHPPAEPSSAPMGPRPALGSAPDEAP